jgi:hypothetical protein
MEDHGGVEETSGETNVGGSLDLITCQYPYLNTSAFSESNSISDLVLKFIFDGSRANQFHINFNLFINGSNLFFSVADRKFGLV